METGVVLQPLTIICRDCHKPFFLDVKEQEWFIRLGERLKQDIHMPKRCKGCRGIRKAKKASESSEKLIR